MVEEVMMVRCCGGEVVCVKVCVVMYDVCQGVCDGEVLHCA